MVESSKGMIISPLLFKIFFARPAHLPNILIAEYADVNAISSLYKNPLTAFDYSNPIFLKSNCSTKIGKLKLILVNNVTLHSYFNTKHTHQ